MGEGVKCVKSASGCAEHFVCCGVYPACCAVRAVVAERGDDPALAAGTAADLHAEWEKGPSSRLHSVVAALSRPARILRGRQVGWGWLLGAAPVS